MTDNKNEHVKLAIRITDMLCQLNEGKALDTKRLADKYEVCRRTIQRDINERLMIALPMLGLNEKGLYALPDDYFGQLDDNDIRHFSMLSGVSDLFPNMDRQFCVEYSMKMQNLYTKAKGNSMKMAQSSKLYLSNLNLQF